MNTKMAEQRASFVDFFGLWGYDVSVYVYLEIKE